jgi:Na+/proline symporter
MLGVINNRSSKLLKIYKIAHNIIEGFNKPFKSSAQYIAINVVLCILVSVLWVLLELLINADFVNFIWLNFWENLSHYKEVGVFLFVSVLYLFLYFKRANSEALLASLLLKFATTLYMINLMVITISKPLLDKSIIEGDKWFEILPYEAEYPFSAMLILTLLWWLTWYSTLKQREIMKAENPEYVDVYDRALYWLKSKSL